MDDRRDLVSQRRRYPATCLYCDAPADSDEHAVPRAMGGRLRARILCGRHNNDIVSKVDKAVTEWFAVWTHMLAVPKQGGKRGSSFVARSVDGRRFKIEPDGRAVDLDPIIERDERGRIVRAVGNRKLIETLQAAKEKSHPEQSMPVFEIPGDRPTLHVDYGLTREVEPGLVKIALHFVAGFFPDVVVPPDLCNVIERNETPAQSGVYVRPLPFVPPLFEDAWPPRHEITAYPGSDATYVTFMLFGAFSMVVRLPGIQIIDAVRYLQRFDGSGPQLVHVEPRAVRWDEAMSDDEWDSFIQAFDERAERIDRFRRLREDHDQCVKAARVARESQRRYNADFIDLFRAELDKYVWSLDKKGKAVAITREMLQSGLAPWLVPMTAEGGGPTYNDALQ